MAHPLVSIGIPTFNRSESLKRSIASVRAQSAQDFEIIIADNGSTDETWRLCQTMASSDPRIHIFRHEPTINSTQNFDFVRLKARGDFVLLLGDDDWIDENYIERCTTVLAARPDHIAVGGRPTYYRDNKVAFQGIVLKADDAQPSRRLLQALAQIIDAGTFHALFRRSVSETIPILNAFGMDYLYVCEAAYCGKIDTLTDTTVHRIDNSHLKPIDDSVRSLGLPPEQGCDHYGTIVALFFWHIMAGSARFAEISFWPRLTLATRAAAIVFKRWSVRDEDGLVAVAQSIFAERNLSDLVREIRSRLLAESLGDLGDPQSRLWTGILPEILPTLIRLAFRQVPPTRDERDLLLRLHDSIRNSSDTAQRDCALTAVRLFY